MQRSRQKLRPLNQSQSCKGKCTCDAAAGNIFKELKPHLKLVPRFPPAEEVVVVADLHVTLS